MAVIQKHIKISNRLKWILIVIGILLVLGWFLVPVLVKNYAINNSKELLGRQIDIGRLRFNFFTGNMHMNGFKMFEPDEKTVFISFDTLNVNIEPYQFLFNKKVVEEFYLQGLYVNIIKQDTAYNFDDLVAFHSAADEEAVDEPESETTFKYILSNLELKDAQFIFDDRNVDHVTQIDDFSFFIPRISWDQAEKSNADIKFNFRKEGYLEASMNVNPVDGAYDARIQIYHLYLNPFLKRIQEYAEVSVVEGLVDTDLLLTGNINEWEKTLVTGSVLVENLEMQDMSSKKFLTAEKALCTFKEIDSYNESYHIDSLIITKPYLFFQLDSASSNIFRIFKVDSILDEGESEESKMDSTQQTEMFYAVNHLGLHDGIMDYTDNLTGQPFEYHLSEIEIETDSIFSDADWLEINAEMLLNERGTLLAQVAFDPVDYMDGELNISVEKFLLPDLNIYTNHYTGHSLVDGDMYYYSQSKLVDGQIESENKLIVKQPTIRDGEGGLYRLPLKLALWLLSDSKGDVTLNVPVRGDLNDPEIDVWKLVWTTLKNKITDAADDPAVSLAPLVGADPKELQAIEFAFTDTIPSAENRQQLDWLLELERVKQGLSVELEYFVDNALQREALAENSMETPRDSVQNAPDAEGPLSTGSEELSVQYSNARIISIRKYLDSVYADTRIRTVRSDSLAPQNAGAYPNFKINFNMQSATDTLP